MNDFKELLSGTFCIAVTRTPVYASNRKQRDREKEAFLIGTSSCRSNATHQQEKKTMSDETGKPAPPTPIGGLVITLVVIIAIAGWIFLGLKLLGITSFFASFLFFWYWAAVEEADLKQWLQSVLGALVGLALAWQSHWLAAQFGTQGLIAGLIVIVVAVYLQIMNWVPIAINRSAMLFLTVLAAPLILEKLEPVETMKAIGLSALYFGAIVKVLAMISRPKQGE